MSAKIPDYFSHIVRSKDLNYLKYERNIALKTGTFTEHYG